MICAITHLFYMKPHKLNDATLENMQVAVLVAALLADVAYTPTCWKFFKRCA